MDVCIWVSLVTQTVKYQPAMWETGVQSLGREDPPEKGMATHSSILARRISLTEEPGGLQSIEAQKSWMWLSKETTTTNPMSPDNIQEQSLGEKQVVHCCGHTLPWATSSSRPLLPFLHWSWLLLFIVTSQACEPHSLLTVLFSHMGVVSLSYCSHLPWAVFISPKKPAFLCATKNW